MSNLEKWNLIAGFLSPPVIAIIQQSHWSQKLRASVTFVFACLVALGTVYWQSDLTWGHWMESALTVLVAAVATYHGFWQPTKVAPTVEKATTANPPPT
jgi:hypothetical protein